MRLRSEISRKNIDKVSFIVEPFVLFPFLVLIAECWRNGRRSRVGEAHRRRRRNALDGRTAPASIIEDEKGKKLSWGGGRGRRQQESSEYKNQ
jgi:hypothetical protein